jgi:metal-dependent amidase/aminoacylase/carboxypeptidase family protein
MVGLVRAAAAQLAAAGQPSAVSVVEVEPSLAAEDFSFYRAVVPQPAFTFLGIGSEQLGTTAGLHTPRFQVGTQNDVGLDERLGAPCGLR